MVKINAGFIFNRINRKKKEYEGEINTLNQKEKQITELLQNAQNQLVNVRGRKLVLSARIAELNDEEKEIKGNEKEETK